MELLIPKALDILNVPAYLCTCMVFVYCMLAACNFQFKLVSSVRLNIHNSLSTIVIVSCNSLSCMHHIHHSLSCMVFVICNSLSCMALYLTLTAMLIVVSCHA